MTNKETIRVTGRAAREAFAASPHPDIIVSDTYLAMLSRGLTVASYVPVRGEADPTPLARAAVAAGCVIALPHVTDRTAPLRFLAWDTEAALVAGPMGLHQPAESAEELAPDIVLTPLIAFDRRLGRLGQGAGYYDRAFTRFPDAHRIGVAWSVQEVGEVPTDPWDVALHAIATEIEWITP
ncbi:5-formyltetrahydrofolate cyclo-ligase [Sphingomonas sp. SUN019]|uniref:5-formyltetrahydrofolate cyclo-ligase n=1 Tax=Sphingomonas sp. SUN019 TaxID=2937788 RepID=UPI002164E986|nr:5-formyltetrahydrofolate cyclo-ligase [Sphingomonas sp. SUN019]UVO52118.1 5-formyltetrahydrofolate cyclo-ligase [Sphingomonas sp. SUN019]